MNKSSVALVAAALLTVHGCEEVAHEPHLMPGTIVKVWKIEDTNPNGTQWRDYTVIETTDKRRWMILGREFGKVGDEVTIDIACPSVRPAEEG